MRQPPGGSWDGCSTGQPESWQLRLTRRCTCDGGQGQTVNRVKTPEATGSGMIPLGPAKAMADALVRHLSREDLQALVGILTERL